MKKNNWCALIFLGVSVGFAGGLSGCSSNGAKKNTEFSKSAAKSKMTPKEQIVVINDKAVLQAKKDEQARLARQAEYEKKRMRYNQDWVAKQDARRNAQKQQYHQKFQQQQLAQSQQAERLPHYGHQAGQNQHYNHGQQRLNAQRSRARGAIRSRSGAAVRSRTGSVVRSRRASVNLAEHLSSAAIARTYQRVRYDGRYIPLSYPMGDVPANIGVCTDTLIRSYRRLGVDLQQLVHEDMSRAFHAYPNLAKWRLSAPDPNIDHRRVHNLKVFFARHGRRLPVTNNPEDYRPGDLVTWHLGGDQEHIGIVVNRRSPEDPRRYMIVHNIAKGDRMEDMLFKLPITGHYRYLPNRNRFLASAQ